MLLRSNSPRLLSRDPEATSVVLQSTYPSGARTGQGSLPPAPVTSAVLQSTYPGALETTVPSSSEPPTETPPVLRASAAREAAAYPRSFEWEAGRL